MELGEELLELNNDFDNKITDIRHIAGILIFKPTKYEAAAIIINWNPKWVGSGANPKAPLPDAATISPELPHIPTKDVANDGLKKDWINPTEIHKQKE